jgi:hypothetical protein
MKIRYLLVLINQLKRKTTTKTNQKKVEGMEGVGICGI